MYFFDSQKHFCQGPILFFYLFLLLKVGIRYAGPEF